MNSGIKMLSALNDFAEKQNISGKGALSVVLTLTRNMMNMDFPLRAENFLSPKEGQVAGLGGAAVKKILKEHGELRTLATEGGRTSRGSIEIMKAYVDCLNSLWRNKSLDLSEVEKFWVLRVIEYFSASPFKLKLDKSLSIRVLFRELMTQAKKRQLERPGSTVAGTVAQHLIAAKLICLMGKEEILPHAASAADSSRSTGGDFEVGDSIVHVTLAPTEFLIEKCVSNLSVGKSPIIVTGNESISHAISLAEGSAIADRIEVWGFEQYLSTNIHEWSRFSSDGMIVQVFRLVEAYNSIISELDEEPSLKIEI